MLLRTPDPDVVGRLFVLFQWIDGNDVLSSPEWWRALKLYVATGFTPKAYAIAFDGIPIS